MGAAERTPPTNEDVAVALKQVADLLESHGANPFRVRAYRTAAETIHGLPEPLSTIVERAGVDGLLELPGIGKSLAPALEHFLKTGRLPLLDRLQGKNVAEHLFATVANIGPKLGHRIHEQLGIETLAELRAAALDGRLALVPGMGPKRLQAVRESLAGRMTRALRADSESRPPAPVDTSVPVAELLDVDREYRDAVRRGKLPRIAPRRFNPTGEAWLPILHTHRGDRHYTAMFSNTARAHEMNMTHDWVVIYRDDADGDGRWTVITAAFGPLAGQRVVAGREAECASRPEHETSPLSPASPRENAA